MYFYNYEFDLCVLECFCDNQCSIDCDYGCICVCECTRGVSHEIHHDSWFWLFVLCLLNGSLLYVMGLFLYSIVPLIKFSF